MSTNYFNPFFTVKVMDGLFICNQTATKDQQFLMNNKFGLIINTCPLEFKVLGITHVYRVVNFHWQNSRGNMIDSIEMKLFRGVFDEIGKSLEEGQGVLVVSDRGHSRAITFVLLYLMSKFGWDLFKALEYINSKRENLQVRAAYLKLLVNYEKVLKSQTSLTSNESKIKQNTTKENTNKLDIPSQIKQSQSNKRQKWSQTVIKSPQQQLLTNTFINTCKKHKINQLNQQYREMLAKQGKEEKRPESNNRGMMNTSKEWNRKASNNSSTKKKVQFSNEIEIIIKKSQVSHIFPQYEELSSEHIIEYERDTRASTQSSKTQHLQGIHSHNSVENSNNNKITNITNKGAHTNKQPQQKPHELQASRPSSKKEMSTVPNITNSKMVNVRKMERPANYHAGNMLSATTNRQIVQNELIVLSNSQDLYSNEFYQSNIKREEDRLSQRNMNNSMGNQLSLTKKIKESSISKQSLRTSKPHEQSQTTKSNQASTQFRTQQLLNYQIRPSSLKKFKANFIDEKQRKASSPKKKDRKQDRILTEPKYDYEFENPALDEDEEFKEKSRRRLSASQNSEEGYLASEKIYQHHKSASTTMAMKMMNKFQKKSSTPIKNEKRCPTPQLINGETNRQLRSSSHNNFFTRPLSRGGSNSLRMSTKKSATSSIQENGLQKQNKLSGAIFNVNINVNIGKLQMFGTKNRDSRQSITNSLINVNKEKLSKVHSHLDKSQLLYNRIRSNSSNDNYSKFSGSSLSVGEKSDDRIHKQQGMMGKKPQQKLLNKDQIKVNHPRESHSGYHDRTQQFIGHEPFHLQEDDNIFGSESFTKKEIMDKINRKLIKNSRNTKVQEHTKKTSILQNNFV